MIEASHITKTFGRLRALNDLSVRLERGQAVSLIGPNGSGKTTFIKCILGLVLPDSGSLTLDGVSLLHNPGSRRRIGYMPQIGRFPDNMRIGQVFEMLQEVRRGTYDRLDHELIEGFQLEKMWHKTMRTLSGGTRQKVSACLAFLFDPDVLILDEPTAGLDPVSAELLKEKVLREKSKGKLVLVTSHILSDLDELTSDVMYLMEGDLQFYKPIGQLKTETGEEKLGRAIAHLMTVHG
jgi:Cu-processing system ATP-binding protein